MNYHNDIVNLGGAYRGGALIREVVLVLKILLSGGALLLENGHSLDHLQ